MQCLVAERPLLARDVDYNRIFQRPQMPGHLLIRAREPAYTEPGKITFLAVIPAQDGWTTTGEVLIEERKLLEPPPKEQLEFTRRRLR